MNHELVQKVVDVFRTALVLEDLGMGITEEIFHLLGKIPDKMDKLNSLVTGAAILTASAVSFNISWRSYLDHLI